MREFDLMSDLEDRRPGLGKICRQIRRKHSFWSTDTVIAHAKIEWHRRNPA